MTISRVKSVMSKWKNRSSLSFLKTKKKMKLRRNHLLTFRLLMSL
jgi:hypothetical protein